MTAAENWSQPGIPEIPNLWQPTNDVVLLISRDFQRSTLCNHLYWSRYQWYGAPMLDLGTQTKLNYHHLFSSSDRDQIHQNSLLLPLHIAPPHVSKSYYPQKTKKTLIIFDPRIEITKISLRPIYKLRNIKNNLQKSSKLHPSSNQPFPIPS